MSFDPARRLVMATFKTVHGYGLNSGSPLTITAEPSARGEVDEALAFRLWKSGVAVYADDHRPTPVEAPAQEKVRLAAEALRDAGSGELSIPDLTVWEADDTETGKKAGAKVTKEDLLAVAAREGVTVETDDNKADLIRKITEARAAPLGGNPTKSESEAAPIQGDDAATGATARDDGSGPATGGAGDAHGAAGEGLVD